MGFFQELKRRNVVRMALFYLLGAWVVLQVADVVVGVAGLPDWSLRLVGLVLLLGLPLVLVLSWVYQLTPEGLKKETSVDESGQKVTVTAFQRLVLVASFAVVMAGGYVLIERFLVQQAEQSGAQQVADAPPRTEPVAIAMLPVESDGEVPSFEEYGNTVSLTDKLLETVSGFDDIRVLPPDRITPPEGSEKTARDLAGEQLATHLFHSRTRQEDESAWVTVELTDAKTDERVWAYNMEKPVIEDGQFNAQAMATLWFELGKALEARNLTEMAADTDNALAFEALWQGRHVQYENSWEQWYDRRIAWYEEALMLDPGFVDAYNAIAKDAISRTFGGWPWLELREQAMAAAQKALEIDPDDPDANANMSRILTFERGNTTDAEEWENLTLQSIDFARRAVTLAPRNVSIREDYARALWQKHDWNEIINQIDIILRYDPKNADYLRRWKLSPLVWAGRLEEAEAFLDEMMAKEPGRNWDHGEGVFTLYRAKGDYLRALEALHPIVWAEGNVWVQDYMDLLFDIGALEAALPWGQHFATIRAGQAANFVRSYIMSAMNHLGQTESLLNYIDSVPDTVMNDEAKAAWRMNARNAVAIRGPRNDPAVESAITEIDLACDRFEQETVAEADYRLEMRSLSNAINCFVLSRRSGTDRQRLGDAIVAFFENREPFKTAPGSLAIYDKMKLQLIFVFGAQGKIEEAVAVLREIYDQGFSRPYHFRSKNVVPDLEGIYHGLGSHPEFLEIYNELEARNAAYRGEIQEKAPWLLDPALHSPFTDGWEFPN